MVQLDDYYKSNNESSMKIACSSCNLKSFWQSGILELSLPSLLPLLSIKIICIITVIRPKKLIIVNHPPVPNPISQFVNFVFQFYFNWYIITQ